MPEAGRRKPAHPAPVERHNEAVILWLTVCAQARKPILARDDVHALLRESWAAADSWVVGRYIILPDHLHLFCAPAVWPRTAVEKWVAFWKSLASRRWPRASEQPVWQRDVWDTQLRRCEDYGEKWEYLRRNPVRAGLVVRIEDWPYQGEMTRLDW
jgi:REP element-mobilizing transposase RayT